MDNMELKIDHFWIQPQVVSKAHFYKFGTWRDYFWIKKIFKLEYCWLLLALAIAGIYAQQCKKIDEK